MEGLHLLYGRDNNTRKSPKLYLATFVPHSTYSFFEKSRVNFLANQIVNPNNIIPILYQLHISNQIWSTYDITGTIPNNYRSY